MLELGEWSGGERVCVSHYMKDNVWRSIDPIVPGKMNTCLLSGNRLGIQPQIDLQVIWSPKSLRWGSDSCWPLTGAVMSCNTHKPLLISFQPIPNSSNHFHHLCMTSEIPRTHFHARTQYLSTPNPEHIL